MATLRPMTLLGVQRISLKGRLTGKLRPASTGRTPMPRAAEASCLKRFRRRYKRQLKASAALPPDHKTAAAGIVQRLRSHGLTLDPVKVRRLEKTLKDSMGAGMVQRPRGKPFKRRLKHTRKDNSHGDTSDE